ncbi:transcription factor Adf-1-like [Aphis craccivora]|uniref:Transcription factor Adf-1-like n=1 Tax=Aphis craccivora TaxID=307492 RepID=A0A6G0Y7L1_APHCR|nr:transcription factor Adf-1-like [Aphis craccivora]
MQGPSAKSICGNIRDNFRKSVKKNKTVSSQKAKIIKQYKYAQQLIFITKFFDERDTMSNIDDVNELNENKEYSPNCITEEVDNPKTKYSVPDAPPSKTAAATIMEYLVKKNESMVPLEPKHPVDAFLSGIAPVLKKLTPRYCHYAKSDIFAAVQNYELKMIMDQEQFAQPPPMSTYSTSYSEQSSPAADHPTSTTSSFTNSFSDQNQDITAYFQKY